MGAAGALLEVSGLAPAGAAVFRAALPAPGSEEAPAVVLDTAAPAGGEVVEWLVDDENLAVRGALGVPPEGTIVAHDTAGLARLQAWMHMVAGLGCTGLHACVHMVAGLGAHGCRCSRPPAPGQATRAHAARARAGHPGPTRTIHARLPA